MFEETMAFDVDVINDTYTKTVIKEVYNNLEEKGYNATNQLVGYLISGDPCYISSYKESRNIIMKFDRTKLLEVLVKEYMK